VIDEERALEMYELAMALVKTKGALVPISRDSQGIPGWKRDDPLFAAVRPHGRVVRWQHLRPLIHASTE
jgi:hypothetical protein